MKPEEGCKLPRSPAVAAVGPRLSPRLGGAPAGAEGRGAPRSIGPPCGGAGTSPRPGASSEPGEELEVLAMSKILASPRQDENV